jgi:hypothetical protein
VLIAALGGSQREERLELVCSVRVPTKWTPKLSGLVDEVLVEEAWWCTSEQGDGGSGQRAEEQRVQTFSIRLL